MFIPVTTILPFYFGRYALLASSASAVGASVGNIIFPYVLQFWQTSYGWRYSLVYLACVLIQGTVVAAFFPNRPPKNYNAHDSHSRNDKSNCRSVILKPRCLSLYISSGLSVVGYCIFIIFVADFLTINGYTLDQAAFALSMMGMGTLTSRIVGTIFGISLRNTSIHVVCSSMAIRCVCTFFLVLPISLPLVVFVVFFFGFTWGFQLSLIAIATSDVISDIAYLAAAIGLLSCVMGVVICIAPFLASKYSSTATIFPVLHIIAKQ